MSSSEAYKKKFEEMLRIEEKARDLYKYYVDRIEDGYMLERFREIYKDEINHVAIAQSFINKLSKE